MPNWQLGIKDYSMRHALRRQPAFGGGKIELDKTLKSVKHQHQVVLAWTKLQAWGREGAVCYEIADIVTAGRPFLDALEKQMRAERDVAPFVAQSK